MKIVNAALKWIGGLPYRLVIGLALGLWLFINITLDSFPRR